MPILANKAICELVLSTVEKWCFQNLWGVQNGRCGVCGDPYQGPRENEAGGKYASGVIVRNYTEGQHIQVVLGE